MRGRLALLAIALILSGCQGSSSASNADVAAAAGDLDASKRGVVAQPDSDLSTNVPSPPGKK